MEKMFFVWIWVVLVTHVLFMAHGSEEKKGVQVDGLANTLSNLSIPPAGKSPTAIFRDLLADPKLAEWALSILLTRILNPDSPPGAGKVSLFIVSLFERGYIPLCEFQDSESFPIPGLKLVGQNT